MAELERVVRRDHVDVLNSDQETPLHLAAEFDHIDDVRILLELGQKSRIIISLLYGRGIKRCCDPSLHPSVRPSDCLSVPFLPSDSMHRDIFRRHVSVCVSLSLTLRYCVKTTVLRIVQTMGLKMTRVGVITVLSLWRP